jgi:hypothetical protein
MNAISFASAWRTATLTTPLRDFLGYWLPSPGELFELLQLVTVGASLLLFRAKLDQRNFYQILLVSVLTAPYAWVWDFSVLTPLFFILLALLERGSAPRVVLAPAIILMVFPAYALATRSAEIYLCHSMLMAATYAACAEPIRTLLARPQPS